MDTHPDFAFKARGSSPSSEMRSLCVYQRLPSLQAMRGPRYRFEARSILSEREKEKTSSMLVRREPQRASIIQALRGARQAYSALSPSARQMKYDLRPVPSRLSTRLVPKCLRPVFCRQSMWFVAKALETHIEKILHVARTHLLETMLERISLNPMLTSMSLMLQPLSLRPAPLGVRLP